MRAGRPIAVARSWLGLAAAAIVLCSAAWLTGEYLHAVWVAPAEKALVESLKERARTDATIHRALLQPEFDRQRLALQRRLTAYRWGGWLLLTSLVGFMAWVKLLKPRPGEWAGFPTALARRIDALCDDQHDPLATLRKRPKRKVTKALLAGPRIPVANRSQVRYRVLDSCSGCTICAQVCPLNAIEPRPYRKHEVIDGRCTRCGLCLPACPEQAIDII